MNLSNGLFISLEGGEGSGKTTTAKYLKEWFEKLGKEVLITREPGGVEVSEKIRSVLVEETMSPLTEAMLFAASRNEVIHQSILPALKKGEIVICDRFVDSSYVYQGIVRELGLDIVKEINKPITDILSPDITLYFDIMPEKGLERIKKNNRETNRFDKETIDFHNKIREGYQTLAQMEENENRIHQINADQEVVEVANDCIQILKKMI